MTFCRIFLLEKAGIGIGMQFGVLHPVSRCDT